MKRSRIELALVLVALIAVSAASTWFVSRSGWTLYYGDAEAHLNIARRVLDSRTPGYNQIGSPWLPLPVALTMLFVQYDPWWRNGLAGAIPSSACFVLACAFLFGFIIGLVVLRPDQESNQVGVLFDGARLAQIT